MVNGHEFRAKRAGACPAGAQCVHGGQIRLGDLIGPRVSIGWIHDDDMPQQAVQRQEVRQATESHTETNRPSTARHALPVGTYTVRPADEREAVVIDAEAPTFGSFPDGTVAVSVHGSFAVADRSGLRQARSWYAFGFVFPDGRLVYYQNARALVNAADDQIEQIDRHLRAKVIRASKAVRLMIEADADTLMSYGKAYAATSNQCFVCGQRLLDENSQKAGIGPVCSKKFRAAFGG